MWDLLSLNIIAVFKLLHCIFAGCCRFYIFFCILSFKDFPLILLLRVLQKKIQVFFLVELDWPQSCEINFPFNVNLKKCAAQSCLLLDRKGITPMYA